MSAEILRRAASQMRERAESATPGRWENRRGPGEHVVTDVEAVATIVSTSARADRRHIASWHPAVALAVADWLDTAGADLWAHGPLCECGSGCHECDDSLWQPHVRRALAVARAYLGESA